LDRAPSAVADESQLTWGIQAVRAAESTFSGRGVRVAVLDTGVDLTHPDLRGRIKGTRSFVDGETVADINGHGTHCIGTVGGPLKPAGAPRYGVAPGAQLYAGKVLGGPAGRGTDGWIIAGIAWAIEMGCRVVSMSLGAPTRPGEPFRRAYEVVARRAMARGTLIVAAAGNDSRRPGLVAPVSSPANCPSILAVAAVDRALRVASFSNRGINPSGGQIDLAAPGVDVLSAGIGSQRYRRLNGTSMATPHVAGIAALLGEAFPKATPASLVAYLGRAARRLPLPSTDVGVGLGQAP
jgi:subtilisin family serine protease